MNRIHFIGILVLVILGISSCQSSISTAPVVKREVVAKKKYTADAQFTVYPDRVIQGSDKEAWAVSPTEIKSTYYRHEKTWKLKEDISDMPSLSAPEFPMLEALYNMALEESKQNIIDGEDAYMAGKKWVGVWTRDISYSIHLALAMVDPEISKNSLMKKVNQDNLVIQDTGTGGSWPTSTDRVVWALAAWEIYKVTGDNNWLEQSYTILKNTAERDSRTAFDPVTGLYRGESSFMDWRDQSYPKWMGPTDIYESKALSTNVAHYSLKKILSEMAVELNLSDEDITKWSIGAEELKRSINSVLWLEDKGYYSAYKYPNIMGGQLTEMTDTLGESLAIIQGVTNKKNGLALSENIPVVYFGAPSLYPQLKGVKAYHNKGIWPFVTAYYSWAGAKSGNMAAVDFGLKSLTRASALFLSNYENMVYDNGHNTGTAINSERQLWSVAGYLSLVYRDLFGMNWESEGLNLKPMVPNWVEGGLTLTNFKLREAILNIEIIGTGDSIESIFLDETPISDALIPYTLTGEHKVSITMKDSGTITKINLTDVKDQGEKVPAMKLVVDGDYVNINWKAVSSSATYGVFRNGELITKTEELIFSEPIVKNKLSSYSLVAYSENGIPSPYSNYELVDGTTLSLVVNAEDGDYPVGREVKNPKSNRTFDNYIQLTKGVDDYIDLDFTIEEGGEYFLRFDYTNNNGSVTTNNKCAIRSADLDGHFIGKFVFPQRGGMRKQLGYTNSIAIFPEVGEHSLRLYFATDDDNMNIEINQAKLATLHIIKK